VAGTAPVKEPRKGENQKQEQKKKKGLTWRGKGWPALKVTTGMEKTLAGKKSETPRKKRAKSALEGERAESHGAQEKKDEGSKPRKKKRKNLNR